MNCSGATVNDLIFTINDSILFINYLISTNIPFTMNYTVITVHNSALPMNYSYLNLIIK